MTVVPTPYSIVLIATVDRKFSTQRWSKIFDLKRVMVKILDIG